MNIVFMGTPHFSVPILKALHKTYTVSLVVTQPDKPVGRKRTLTQSPVKETAEALNIPVFQPKNIKKDFTPVLEANPDIIITAAYGQIIPEILLTTPTYKAINVHASLLPKLRGGAPIQRAIEQRHDETGVTIMYMEKGMDTGDIIAQKSLKISETDTSETLFNALSKLGTDLLMETLPLIFKGTHKRYKQDPQKATYAYNIKREEERLDFSKSADILEAKIRAYYPEPNTYTITHGKKLKVIKARLHHCKNFAKNHQEDPNGKVIKHFDDGFAVKCETGILVITYVQLAGKKAMPASDFLNGAGKQLVSVGTVLGV
ncbi:MAG: methionyl-tRNA formyltransferase [Bacillota bacterium]